MSSTDSIQTRSLSSEAARSLVVEIERRGVDTRHISVERNTRMDRVDVRTADDVSLARPVKRVAGAALVGLLIGLVVAAVVIAISSGPVGPVLVGGAIVGVVMGGLIGLYGRLAMNTQVYDADAGGQSFVKVSLVDIDDETARNIRQLVAGAC